MNLQISEQSEGYVGRDTAAAAVAGSINRIIALVRLETDALTRGEAVDWRESVDRKSRWLLELKRTHRGLAGHADEALLRLAASLSEVLRQNSDAIALQMQASRLICGMMASAMDAYSSDGTYSRIGCAG